jgi:hypothetical protein
MVPNLVYKFQMICLKGTDVIEQKTYAGHSYGLEVWA